MGTKLYKVTCKGMTLDITGAPWGVAYVLSENAAGAYTKLRNFLDEQDVGFRKDREMDKVELVATSVEVTHYPDSLMRFIP